MSTEIAALYVDARGPYIDMPGVDAWTIERDARSYNGPGPVVAHPPCANWSRLSAFAHDEPERKSCGPRAVEQVREFGGVLEHPAFSKLWRHMDMPRPGEFADEFGGWSLDVDQCAWGHRARKRTWLYIVGVHAEEVTPRRGGVPTHVVASSVRRHQGRDRPALTSEANRMSPPGFAAWLVAIARKVSS